MSLIQKFWMISEEGMDTICLALRTIKCLLRMRNSTNKENGWDLRKKSVGAVMNWSEPHPQGTGGLP